MQLELGLHPADAARLTRLPLLAPLKAGRARTRHIRIVWHDSPDSALGGQGLALAEQRGVWRLERLRPDDSPWPPGAPAPIVEQARTHSMLAHALPSPLLPVAAFEGRARGLALACEAGPVALTLLDGVIRAVAGEHRACRVTLEGPEPAVLALASSLAGEIRLAVPTCCLAAEAMSVTRGVAPQPRHEGAPELPAGLSVPAAFAHIVGHLTDVILYLAPLADEDRSGPEPVHQMRVAMRRMRTGIRLFRRAVGCPAVVAADAALKTLAGRLAPTRDWDVFVTETAAAVAAAFPGEKRLQRLLAAAERRRHACHVELSAFLQAPDFRRLGIALAALATGDAWQATLGEPEQAELTLDLQGFAARELTRRMRRLVRAGDAIADLDPAALHALRLQAKRLRYAAEIFAPLYPGRQANRFIGRLSRLQDRLGALNDAAVAASLLGELAGAGGSHAFAGGMVLGFVGARGVQARARGERAWERFRRLAPFWA